MLEFHNNMGIPSTQSFISCLWMDPVWWNMALWLKTGYISRGSFLPVSGWSFHRILSYSPCSLLKGLAVTELRKVWSYAALWRTLQTMLHKVPSSVLFCKVNYLWFWINDALLVHLLVADLMHPFTQSCHTSVWSTTMVLSPWTSFENDAELNPLTSTQEIKQHFQLFITAM